MLFVILSKVFGGIWTLKHRCNNSRNRIMKRIWNLIYVSALQTKGSWISTDAHFETWPIFPHGIRGIFISGGVSIGRNCIIFQHVTIGSNTLIDSANIGAPVIGESCYIGAGAEIIGGVKIGKNVRVGANAVVARDVPENCIVTSGKQRVIERDKPLDNKFYHKYNGHWCFYENGKRCEVVNANELELLESSFSKQQAC